ncbi:hypothetical protein [Nostoc sp. KVJ3]|uniref:hypothetical protein n=1 Tax=Nostoc sp. KVJ3 TaxID=457945 RepID=UPI0022386E3E|nr:hypothetical protein [Nostoc sp. KVJ3]
MARASKPADSVELARIMRNKDMEDGIVISYLQSKKRGQTELVCEALRAYYLPFALSAAGYLVLNCSQPSMMRSRNLKFRSLR